MKKKSTIIAALAITLSVSLAPLTLVKAQDKKTEVSVNNFPKIAVTSPMGNFSTSFNGQNITSDLLVSHLGEWLGGDHNHTFQLVKSDTDQLGIKHSVYQHYFKGIKVMDDIISVHEKNGVVTYVNGEFVRNINVNTAPAMAEQEAKSILSSLLRTDEKNIAFGEAENVIAKVFEGKGIKTYDVTMLEASSFQAKVFKIYYIDNSTKKIVKELSQIYNVDTPSVSTTYYKGNQSITVDSYNNGSHRLLDNARRIHTMNALNLTDQSTISVDPTGFVNISGSTEYTSTSPNFTETATRPAVEVHWAITSSYDYYLNRFGRNSYDGNGAAIANFYDIDMSLFMNGVPAGYGFNAGALSFNGVQFMIFGNGNMPDSPGATNTMAAIDVGGHEYSHMVISRNGTGGLNYQAESGALNESFADMLGTAIEFFGDPTRANWTMGEGILNVAPGYIRSMSNPNNAHPVLGRQPDTYRGTFWQDTTNLNADRGGVHTNSGVGNYWFYLLSQGGAGTNDNGRAFNVTGITLARSERIAYHTLTTYLTPNSTYQDAYDGSLQAAIDLYGRGSNEHQQVENAWCAVGLGSCSNVLAVNETTKSDLQNIKIYPNPVNNGQFTIESNKNATYEIYDLSGRLIKNSEKIEKGMNKVNINEVEAGVYLVKVNADGNTVSKKIVVK